MLIWALILTFFTYIYFWVRKRANFWSDRGFPSTEFIFPFGSLKGVGTEKSFCDTLEEFYKKYKGKARAVGAFSFTSPFLIPLDAELAQRICVTDFENFPNRPLYYNSEDDPISEHLLALEGNKWKKRRIMLTPTFSSASMKLMFGILDKVGDQLVNAIQKSTEISPNVEIHELICRYTTDGISNVAFGLDSNSLNDENSEMRKYGSACVDFQPLDFIKFFFVSAFPSFSRKLHIKLNKQSVIDYFYNTFKLSFEHRETSGSYRKDFLQLLLELKRKYALTVGELSAEAFIFFLAGFETSSSVLTFLFYELARNQEMQKRLRDEIFEVVQKNDRNLTYDMFFEMKYLDMVFKEALRKYPPGFNIIRTCENEYKIPGSDLVIPAKTDIQIPVYAFHRDPEYFPNPEKFNPERFSEENQASIYPGSYLPFGYGQRACIGKRYGIMKSKICIVKIIQNFEVLLCDKTPKEPIEYLKNGLFLNPADDIWLEVRCLNNNV